MKEKGTIRLAGYITIIILDVFLVMHGDLWTENLSINASKSIINYLLLLLLTIIMAATYYYPVNKYGKKSLALIFCLAILGIGIIPYNIGPLINSIHIIVAYACFTLVSAISLYIIQSSYSRYKNTSMVIMLVVLAITGITYLKVMVINGFMQLIYIVGLDLTIMILDLGN